MTEQTRPSLLERYQRLIKISRDLASTLNLEELLHRIVNAAADLSDAEQASILLYDQIKQELHFEAATNLDEPLRRGLSVPVDSSIAGWIVTNRQPIILSEANKDSRYFGHIAQVTNVPTHSLMGVPLINKDKVIGALEAINKRSGEFNQEDQDLLIGLASQAAIAIENARLFQQSDLISELVHELRTPMASLSTAAHLLTRSDLPADQRRRITEIIQEETFRISELASSFLDLARMQSGRAQFHMSSFDVQALLEDCDGVMRARATEKGLEMFLTIPKPLPPLTADRDKIKQVVLNLLSNALKYNQPSGKITLSAQSNAKEVLIAVSDTGPGIPPESLLHLFEKFYRVPGAESIASGTGLGLSICKGIVEVHQGSIEVQSAVGVGTTFTVHLPLTE